MLMSLMFMFLNKMSKVNNETSKYELIPFHKLPHNFRKECRQLLNLTFNSYFEYRLVSKQFKFLHLFDVNVVIVLVYNVIILLKSVLKLLCF